METYGTMEMNSIHYFLSKHCAPVLCGVKPSAMFWVDSATMLPDLKNNLCGLVDVTVLREMPETALALVYDRALLETSLRGNVAKQMLSECGYPVYGDVDSFLTRLKSRITATGDFPHEIGLFLGYPPEDVVGFICNRGQNCKLCGAWKVYGDVERARSLFGEYRRCGEYLKAYIKTGKPIQQVRFEYGATG